MKVWKNASTWFTAVAVAVAGVALGGGNPLGPDTAFAKYDASKLTIGGDIRVRGEMRHAEKMGENGSADSNSSQVFQKMRLRFNYETSSDVNFFTELQNSTVWGRPASGTGAAGNLGANNNSVDGSNFGVRQVFVGVKNVGVQGLNMKMGRQKLVFGNQRLLGHFDWDNKGFSHDALRFDYSMPSSSHVLFWSRLDDNNTTAPSGKASHDANLYGFYNTFKQVPNMSIEPYILFLQDGRTTDGLAGVSINDGRVAPDQRRWFLGTRVAGKAMNKAIDYTAEIVYQTGDANNGFGNEGDINALQLAFVLGYTAANVPMKPRFGVEIDYASGSKCNTGTTTGCEPNKTPENLFPTNHLHYGYMDRMAWKNMVNYSGHVKIHPDKVSNLKVHFHILRLANPKDNWYGANSKPQAVSNDNNTKASLGQELDIIYTRKFKGGKFGMQIGYGHFFTGEYGKKTNAGTGGSFGSTGAQKGDTDQDWGYVSFTTKF